jgi:hypothetical protein
MPHNLEKKRDRETIIWNTVSVVALILGFFMFIAFCDFLFGRLTWPFN